MPSFQLTVAVRAEAASFAHSLPQSLGIAPIASHPDKNALRFSSMLGLDTQTSFHILIT
jgi:hypothetical protein